MCRLKTENEMCTEKEKKKENHKIPPSLCITMLLLLDCFLLHSLWQDTISPDEFHLKLFFKLVTYFCVYRRGGGGNIDKFFENSEYTLK